MDKIKKIDKRTVEWSEVRLAKAKRRWAEKNGLVEVKPVVKPIDIKKSITDQLWDFLGIK